MAAQLGTGSALSLTSYNYSTIMAAFKTTRYAKIFGMRGWDPGASVFRSWTVTDTADFSAVYYTGAGAGTLTGITVAWVSATNL